MSNQHLFLGLITVFAAWSLKRGNTVSIWTQMLEKTGTIDNQYIHMRRQAQREDCWEKWGMGTGKQTRGFDADRTSSFGAAASPRIASSRHPKKAPRPRGSSLTFRFLKQTVTLNVQERTPTPPPTPHDHALFQSLFLLLHDLVCCRRADTGGHYCFPANTDAISRSTIKKGFEEGNLIYPTAVMKYQCNICRDAWETAGNTTPI